MVRVSNPDEYTLKRMEVATDGKHKYVAVLEHKESNKERRVPFGALGYEQFKDKLGVYSDFDHGDTRRRNSFLKRHAKNIDHKYSSAWFSKVFLW